MRMKNSRLETKYIRNRILTQDEYGGSEESWGTAIAITCETWGEESSVDKGMSGQSLKGIHHLKIEGEYTIEQEGNHQKYVFGNFNVRETDGVCLYVGATSDPDYEIVGITPYRPLLLTLARKK